jgi:hypothetical protein
MPLASHSESTGNLRHLVPLLLLALAGTAAASVLSPGPEAATDLAEPLPTHAADGSDDTAEPCIHCLRATRMLRRLTAGPGLRSIDTPEGLDTTDVLNYSLELEPNFTSRTLAGTMQISVRSLVDGLAAMELELHQNFTIASATARRSTQPAAAAAPVTISRPAADQRLNVAFPAQMLPLTAGDEFIITISYSGAPSSGTFGGTAFTTHNNGSQQLVYTLAEPWYTHTWMPVKENNSDKATANLSIIVPTTMKVAANGLRQGIDALSGSRSRHRWATNYPTSPYLIAFAATNYDEFTSTWTPPGGGTPMLLQFFIYPERNTTANRNAWLQTGQMLTILSSRFGPYPFLSEKYGIYSFPFNGGMEHQTMSGQGTFNSSVTAHELAHQWWGDLVTCQRWNDIWLNEGFATYGEALYLEAAPGSTGTQALLDAMAARRPTTVNGSVYAFDISDPNALFSTLQYRKGAWVLHMLRHIIGDEAFFATLAAYRQQFAYSTATTEDFIAVCQAVTGRDLSWFFQPWIFGIGAPAYSWSWQPVTVGTQSYAEVYIRQSQQASYPLFPMPIDVQVRTAAGTAIARVQNNHREDWLLVPLDQPATAADLDPSNYVLATSKSQLAAGAAPASPPKLVALSVAPGSTQPAPASPLSVTFHKAINIDAGTAPAATISRSGNGSAPVTLVPAGSPLTFELTGTGNLPAGAYTVTLRAAAITSIGATPVALDGELPGSGNIAAASVSPSPLPSGDGAPGGDAVWSFNLTRGTTTCLADITGTDSPFGPAPDGTVDGSDFVAFINSFSLGDTTLDAAADLVGTSGPGGTEVPDGTVDGSDFIAFINAFAVGC